MGITGVGLPSMRRENISQGRPTLFAALDVRERGLSQRDVVVGERRREERMEVRAVDMSLIDEAMSLNGVESGWRLVLDRNGGGVEWL